MAASIEKVYNVSCKIYQNGNFLINDNQTATHLFYIAREAVTNSIKHGKSESIRIQLTENKAGLIMSIRDNGTGAVNENKGIGLGLRIMKYRASVVGADFHAGNYKQGGFEVTVKLHAAQQRPEE
jgi:signal transduction histidine kinase